MSNMSKLFKSIIYLSQNLLKIKKPQIRNLWLLAGICGKLDVIKDVSKLHFDLGLVESKL